MKESRMMKAALDSMERTVEAILVHNAKLGLPVAMMDARGKPRLMSARYLLRKRRIQVAAKASASGLD